MSSPARTLALALCISFGLGLALSPDLVRPLRATEGEAIDFNRDVRPILSDRCFQCHGPDERQRRAGLRLDRQEGSRALRDGRAAIVPGDPSSSELIRRVTHADPDERMPPAESGRVLTPGEIEVLRRWIARGGDYARHWAFIPPVRPALPAVRDVSRARNPIDLFVLARLEKEGLSPSPEAPPETLIRRAHFDLTGLPPTVEEIDAFLADRAPDAYDRLLDRLLASPSFGEHRAVSWLDAARYADTNGYNNDTPRHQWRWRDWVIEAYNADLPFDRFATEQLAGDLLPGASLSQQLATGFNRNHNITSEGGIIDEEYRLEYVADRVQTVATVFLALTLRCARCHDHKFDPISQKEYYRFFAFFNQVPEKGYDGRHGNAKPVIDAPTREQSEELEAIASDISRLRSAVDEGPEDRRLGARLEELSARREMIQKSVPTAMVMRDRDEPRDTFVLRRGEYDKPVEKVRPGVPAIFPPLAAGSPSNRLGLARWLTSPDHPLTARVAVNRLWYQVFGDGIVETLEDFGSQGAWPTHPELLDWLATEFVRSGWDVKKMLRLMLGSATYRQSCRLTEELARVDPRNRLLARGPRLRLDAETIRDSALCVSGLLQYRQGGPSVRPYQPPGLWVEVSVADDSYSGGPYRQDHGAALYRRSVYTYWKRTCPPPALSALDAPEREFCTVQRSRTNTPLQALVLLNDPTYVEAARVLAERLLVEAGESTSSRIAFAFRRATAREPRAPELAILQRAYRGALRQYGRDRDAAARLVEVGDSRPREGLDVVELAAWTTVTGMILNLDETITKG